MKALLFFLVSALCLPLDAQLLSIDFSSSDLSQWLGDQDKFTVSGGQLQLQDLSPSGSNTAYLSVPAPTSLSETTIWECWVQLDFPPSGSNFARIYLAAAQPDLSAGQKAYYLQIGGISGDQDAIALYRQDGSSSTLLLSAQAGGVGGSTALARVQVSRSETGLWSLLVDYSGGQNFQPEGEVMDNTYDLGRFFGFFCQYSATRSDAFFFDDLLVDPLFEDLNPPVLVAARPLDQNTLEVVFDEFIDPASASNPGNYELSGGLGPPADAQAFQEDPARVLLRWDQAFTNLATYTLTLSGVADENGNTSGEQSIDFTYLDLAFPAAGDLLVTELLPDPSPPLGLPNAEFIELYNAGEKVLELEGTGISTGGSPRELPAFQLFPGAYVIVCDEADLADFSALGPALGVSGLPALTNGGDQLIVTGQDGEILVDLTYDLSWYRDNEKADGGWSLELIRTNRVLDCPGNWIASQATAGGTPGRENSVSGMDLETAGPVLISAYAESELEIVLRFDEVLDEMTAGDPSAYIIDGGLVITDAFLQPNRREVLLILDAPLQPGITYQVQATTEIYDCLGNAISEPAVRPAGLAEVAQAGDVVINEILFSPEVGGADFIELYNRSGKIIDLLDWSFNNRQPDGTDRREHLSANILVFPGEYVVFSEEPEDILERYTVNFPERLFSNDLPTMSNAGELSIFNSDFVRIDSFAYSDELHSPLLSDPRGVSLERVDVEAPTNSSGNWHSAAGTAGFATPTYKNSQQLPTPGRGSNVINLAQKRFSPDGDGFEDLLLLQVETDRPGYLASVHIYDATGRLVRRLLRNELLPTEGLYKWDGARDDGHKARIGIYVLWMELVHPDGTVERRQESCVLAGKLE